MKKYVNKITKEVWVSDNPSDETLIEGSVFIKVRKDNQPRYVLMNKDSLVEMITNDNFSVGTLLQG